MKLFPVIAEVSGSQRCCSILLCLVPPPLAYKMVPLHCPLIYKYAHTLRISLLDLQSYWRDRRHLRYFYLLWYLNNQLTSHLGTGMSQATMLNLRRCGAPHPPNQQPESPYLSLLRIHAIHRILQPRIFIYRFSFTHCLLWDWL